MFTRSLQSDFSAMPHVYGISTFVVYPVLGKKLVKTDVSIDYQWTLEKILQDSLTQIMKVKLNK